MTLKELKTTGVSIFWLCAKSNTRDEKMRDEVFQLARSLTFYSDVMKLDEISYEEKKSFFDMLSSFLKHFKKDSPDMYSDKEHEIIEVLKKFKKTLSNGISK